MSPGFSRAVVGALAACSPLAAAAQPEPVRDGTGESRPAETAPGRPEFVEEILQSGQASLGELLQTLPVQANGMNGNWNNGGDGTVRVNLRGLGERRTLVLLNGVRNLLDASPPRVYWSWFPSDPSYDFVGSFFYLRVTHRL
jgi:outer membrane receptor protein involved in Fe transport